jgi:hypothetical protein
MGNGPSRLPDVIQDPLHIRGVRHKGNDPHRSPAPGGVRFIIGHLMKKLFKQLWLIVATP